MFRTQINLVKVGLSIAWLVSVAVACATTSEISPHAISGMLAVRNGLIDGKAQIQKVTGSATELVDQPRPGVQAQVNAFTSQVAPLNKSVVHTRDQASEM